jgi:hypothetical protein
MPSPWSSAWVDKFQNIIRLFCLNTRRIDSFSIPPPLPSRMYLCKYFQIKKSNQKNLTMTSFEITIIAYDFFWGGISHFKPN